ncbi:recombinase family protein [Streptomyces sp. NPDC001758]
MRPAIYGYMRVVSSDETDDESERVKRELAGYAQREGFTLDQVFTENIRCSESAFYVMLDSLKRHDVKNVIVPSLWHFARLPGLQDAMRQHIEQKTGARIWVVQGQRR